MTHLVPGGATCPAAAHLSGRHSASLAPLGIDYGRLRETIAAKRTQIALIEMEWVATCERREARNAGRAVRVEHRET